MANQQHASIIVMGDDRDARQRRFHHSPPAMA
jgi:hypothetical protein